MGALLQRSANAARPRTDVIAAARCRPPQERACDDAEARAREGCVQRREHRHAVLAVCVQRLGRVQRPPEEAHPRPIVHRGERRAEQRGEGVLA